MGALIGRVCLGEGKATNGKNKNLNRFRFSWIRGQEVTSFSSRITLVSTGLAGLAAAGFGVGPDFAADGGLTSDLEPAEQNGTETI